MVQPYRRHMTAPLPPNARVPEYGALVGSWTVQERIGSGSHGVVFRVVRADRQDGKSYALKLALQKDDPRLEREVWLLSNIRHSSVPRLEGSGLWTSPLGDTYPYVVMEWVEGSALYTWAEEQGLTLRKAMSVLAQVARALEATHRYGLHRDVKGGNICVSAKGRAVLLDFGSGSYKSARPLTDGGLPPGTERYRSPQLIFLRFARRLGSRDPQPTGPADDVYALGVTAYRLLAGAYPPQDPDSESELPAKPTRLLAPRGLEEQCPELGALVLRMLAEDPLPRSSAKQVAEKLEALIESGGPELDKPWVVSSKQPPTEETERLAPPSPPPPAPKKTRAPLAPGGAVIALVLALLLLPSIVDRREGGFTEAAWCGQPMAEKPDGGTGQLGDEALSSVKPSDDPPISLPAISRKVPKKPLDDQARPPCKQKNAVVINGGCWRRQLEDAGTAPCDADLYEHEGRCYMVIRISERPPTSDPP